MRLASQFMTVLLCAALQQSYRSSCRVLKRVMPPPPRPRSASSSASSCRRRRSRSTSGGRRRSTEQRKSDSRTATTTADARSRLRRTRATSSSKCVRRHRRGSREERRRPARTEPRGQGGGEVECGLCRNFMPAGALWRHIVKKHKTTEKFATLVADALIGDRRRGDDDQRLPPHDPNS